MISLIINAHNSVAALVYSWDSPLRQAQWPDRGQTGPGSLAKREGSKI